MANVLLSTKAVGSTVKLKVNGTAKEFIVVHQGKPSSLYDNSCDGTWLLMKDIYENRQWHNSNVNNLENSTIHSYLNGTFLNLFESNIRDAIKQVKLPYRKNGGSGGSDQSGANGLLCKIFLLSVLFLYLSIPLLSERCYDPCNFHRKNLKRYSARHNIKPYLTGCLRFSYRRCDYSDNYRKRTDTADYVRYADKLKQSRVTASVYSILNSLVKSVTGCGETAYNKAVHKQYKASQPPVLCLFSCQNTECYVADKDKYHYGSRNCDPVLEI